MRRVRWYHFVLVFLLIPQLSSAIQLTWTSGASDLTFTTATRCTLVVRADLAEGRLPPQWRLLWVADSCEIRPVPLTPHASCQQDVAEALSVNDPTAQADVAGNVLTARFCSDGTQAASAAWYVLDLPAGGKGRFKVAALDPTDPESTRVLQSPAVSFNGGVDVNFPPAILRTSTVHLSTEFRLMAVGAGLGETHAISLAASDGSWRLPLGISSRGDTAVIASASLAANVPACVLEAQTDGGGIGSATLAADPPPPSLDPQSGCQENFIEDIYPPDTIQPKDFAFVPGGWTPMGSWTFHLLYIRQNQHTKNYPQLHGGLDFTEKNLGHAVSNDLHV